MKTAYAHYIAVALLIASIPQPLGIVGAKTANTYKNATTIVAPFAEKTKTKTDASEWEIDDKTGHTNITWAPIVHDTSTLNKSNKTNETQTGNELWKDTSYKGSNIPMRFITLVVKHNNPINIKISSSESKPYLQSLPRTSPIVPKNIDGTPRPELVSDAEPANLPSSPAFVMREAYLSDTRLVVLAISKIFQPDNTPRELTNIALQVEDSAVALSDEQDMEQLDRFLAMGDVLSLPKFTPAPNVRPRMQNSQTDLACVNNVPTPANAQARSNAVKIQVANTGIQRVTGADLIAAGLKSNATDASKLRLFHRGNEVAIDLHDSNNNNRLDSGESFYFYAPNFSDRWNTKDFYWLTTDSVTGLRMSNGTVNLTPSTPTANTAFETGLWRQPKDYDSLFAGPSADHWFSRDMKTDSSATAPEASVPVTLTNVLPLVAGNATITVLGTVYTRNESRLSVKLGSSTSSVATKNGMGNWAPSFQVNSTTNNLTVYLNRSTRPTGFWLDKVTWQRPVSLDFRGAGASFVVAAGAKRNQLSNTPNGRMLYDITNENAPKTINLTGATNTEFQSGANGGTFILTGNNNVFSPAVSAYNFVDLVAPRKVNAVYIAPPAFQGALQPLVAHRQNQGYSVLVVDPQNIYDWFNFGLVSPEAIRSYLRYINDAWDVSPTAVVLVGDGTVDPQNFKRNNFSNFIPPYLADVDLFIGETSCETCFVRYTCDDPKADLLPDAYIGRLPVNTSAQLSTLVNKIINYETSTDNGVWRNSVAFFADNTDEAGSFALSNERLNALQPPTTIRKRQYYFELSDNSPTKPAANETWYDTNATSTNQKIIKIINDGNSILNYNGHGNWKVWGAPTLLDPNQIDSFKNTNRPSILLSWTCLTGQFQNAFDTASIMDERFLLHPTGGAVATWSPSGWDVIEAHDKLAIGFYRKLWSSPSGSQTIGALTMAGYQLLSANSCCTAPLWTYLILGDPLTRVRAYSGVAPMKLSLPATLNLNNSNGGGGSAAFNSPAGLAMSSDGKYAIVADAQNHTVRRIDIATGAVTIIAGSTSANGAVDGTSSAARFDEPRGIAISADNKFALIADFNNHAIRKINLENGQVTTLAGKLGQSGSQNGAGTNASFNRPSGVAISGDGLFALVADSGNNLIRKINLTTGEVTTLAGAAGVTGSTNGSFGSALFNNPTAIALNGDGSVALVTDTGNHTIRRINLLKREVSTVAGMAGVSGSADGLIPQSRLNAPQGVWLSADTQYAMIADTGNNTIRRLWLADNRLETLMGKAGQTGKVDAIGSAARFNAPTSIAVSLDGSLVLLSDSGNNEIRRLTGATKIFMSFVYKSSKR